MPPVLSMKKFLMSVESSMMCTDMINVKIESVRILTPNRTRMYLGRMTDDHDDNAVADKSSVTEQLICFTNRSNTGCERIVLIPTF